ncbi:MAG: putative LacI-family transcriptional regulator [Nocardioides sp.]|nr:putative LacI-family transcriptional regulator [Nocardioides sp.]
MALGLLQQATSAGVRVPEDLALVGYDDIDVAAAAAVPLTSVRQPRAELGRTAAKLLLDEADNAMHVHEQVVFEPELVARRSTQQVVGSPPQGQKLPGSDADGRSTTGGLEVSQGHAHAQHVTGQAHPRP